MIPYKKERDERELKSSSLKNIPYFPLCILMILSAALLLCSFATFRQETGSGYASTTSAHTPRNTEKGGTLWTHSFAASDGRYSYNSDPIICDSVIYIANYTTLYELDRQNGTVLRTLPLASRTDSVCHMLLEGNQLMVPLSGGIVECIDTDKMTSLWQSDSFGGQSLSTLYYHDGYLYAGTVNMVSGTQTTGTFYCIDTRNGSTQWTYKDTEHPGGYYWSGAVSCGGALYFTGDNGILVSHSLTTAEVYDTFPLTTTAKIRAGLTYNPDTNSLYTADTSGQIYRIPLSANTMIQKEEILSGSAVPEASSSNCTSTPAIWNNRLYVGSIADGYGHLSVLDAATLSLIYTVQGERSAEIKSSPLISTGYSSAENNNRVYIYVSANQMPGGIYYLMDDSTSTNGTLHTLYIPAMAKQFCMSSITADRDGILYYSNDSNTLFAVSEVENSSDKVNALPSESPVPTSVPDDTPSPDPVSSPPAASSPTSKKNISGQAKKPKKPTKIKTARKKKRITLYWKKQKKTQTLVYIRYSSGKWKKKIIKNKSAYTIPRKKKKTVYCRLRSRVRSGSGWIYSTYTKTYKVKYSTG